jgi:hypothetical protein
MLLGAVLTVLSCLLARRTLSRAHRVITAP